jgi:TM2 domain-containing membrane protein YozV
MTTMSTYTYPNPQAIFYQQFQAVRRDEVVGILMALFLGTFGAHHFYLRRTGLGILYCCFFWSGVPAILGFIECFFMPARVREFNAIQAAAIAATLGIPVPIWNPAAVPAGVAPVQPAQPGSAAPAAGFVPATGFVAAAAPTAAQALCPNCQKMNPPGARFCTGCGMGLQGVGSRE